jgi:hypothetical protein
MKTVIEVVARIGFFIVVLLVKFCLCIHLLTNRTFALQLEGSDPSCSNLFY